MQGEYDLVIRGELIRRRHDASTGARPGQLVRGSG